jgi:DnaK suppressor protein
METAMITDDRIAMSDLRRLLETRRQQITGDLQRRMARIRDLSADPSLAKDFDDGDPCALDARLVELASATLRRIDLALTRLDEGRYGRCVRCRGRISLARLRAVPFAVSCRRCEDAGEADDPRRRRAHNAWARDQMFPSLHSDDA